jgi:hypothetical protein
MNQCSVASICRLFIGFSREALCNLQLWWLSLWRADTGVPSIPELCFNLPTPEFFQPDE